MENEFSFNLAVVSEIFKEVEIYFPDQLTKSYEDLIEFNQQITSERKALLKDSLNIKTEALKKVKLSLLDLNKRKGKFRDIIQDNTILKKERKNHIK